MIEFSLAKALILLKPLVIFIIGIAIYAIFVFIFYRFLARQKILKLNLKQYNRVKHKATRKLIGLILYFIEYLLISPFFILLWTTIMTGLLLFLSKNNDVQNILLISMAIVGAIRIAAYYSEDLAKDLAKMLPFALLGIYLVDTSYLSFSQSISLIWDIPVYLDTLIYYFIFLIFLEFILRIIYTIQVFWVAKGKDKKKTEELEEKGGVYV